MSPAYMPGQVVIVLKPWRALAIGDVIVFEHNSIEKIKRIKTLDAQGLYVYGDNTSASTDSRDFGVISHSSVLGIIIWPKKIII